MIKTPCLDCKDRKIACHDRCEKYQEWRARRAKYIEEERAKKQIVPEYGARVKYHVSPVLRHK